MEKTEKVCGNCTHLFISGMLKSWGGTAGYCLLNNNRKGITKKQKRPIKQINETCAEFKNK